MLEAGDSKLEAGSLMLDWAARGILLPLTINCFNGMIC
jgi:hypothetical protein